MAKWLIALVLAGQLLAGQREWKHGTLLAIDEQDRFIDGTSFRNWRYSISDGNLIYEAERKGKRPIQLEVNGDVSFTVDGGRVYLRADNHEYRLSLIKTTRKP